MTRPNIGTVGPIFVPRKGIDDAKPIGPGEDYFFVQIIGAQASFTGSIWEKVKRLLVASQVNLNHSILGTGSLRALQHSREVKKGLAEKLGLRPNLINLVPAVMPNISLSVEFILDKENKLAELSGLINDDAFLAAVSLAPGTATVAKTVGGLAEKIIQSFVPAEQREPILQFSGDFNLAGQGLKEGYYIILGTRDAENPIPSPVVNLEVQDGELLLNGSPLTQFSYVIFEVGRVAARTRELNDGAAWDAKLREAQNLAEEKLYDPLVKDKDRKEAWEKCRELLREAQVLLRADQNYHAWEADRIIGGVFQKCVNLVSEEKISNVRNNLHAILPDKKAWSPNFLIDRAFLGISADEDLNALSVQYANKVKESSRVLRDLAIR